MTTPKIYPFQDDDPGDSRPEPVEFETLVTALIEEEASEGVISTAIYYGLSELSDENIERLRPIWEGLDDDYRLRLMEALTGASETNFDLDYSAFGQFALRDESAAIRAAAIDLLWDDVSLEHMHVLMSMATSDESPLGRAAAASGLGRFIYAGEIDELPIEETNKAQELAHSIYRNAGEEIDVRRRALEALANSSNDNVNAAIRDAYESSDHRMNVSALYAMGRSCDETWAEIVLEEITDSDDEIRYEAARAAGELDIEEAVPDLVKLASDPDREIQEVAIWSLGEIGGDESLRVLNHLLQRAVKAKDEGLKDAIEEAIGNASLSRGALYMLDYGD